MSNLERDDYKFLRIVDAMDSINQKVNLFGIVTDAGTPKQSKGTDCCCTLRIVDESHRSPGISVNVFAETFEKLPHVESVGDIIQLSSVVMKIHELVTYAVFNKKFSSFALYEGKDGTKFVPYQVSSKFYATEQDRKIIANLRNWAVNHQPETGTQVSNDSLSLKDISQGCLFNLTCKVLYISEVTQGECMLFVWDGTDAPPVNIHTKLEEEVEKPLPLQLETPYLSRDVLCSFPSVGTVLRMRADRCNERVGLKPGRWVQFRNVKVEVFSGLWCGILKACSRFSYLFDDNEVVSQRQREYDERFRGQWSRMPWSTFPWPSHVTETEHQDVPFVTLMDILSYSEVTAKFRCVVRVVAMLPSQPSDFRDPCGTYRVRLTLEDPTARIHAFLYAQDAVKFFGGYPSNDKMMKMQNALLGVEETNVKLRYPPWVDCCLKSYYVDKTDIWGSRRYRIFDTKLSG